MAGRSDYSSTSNRDEGRRREEREDNATSYRSEKSGNRERSSYSSRSDLDRSRDYGRRDRSNEGRKDYGNRQYGKRQFAPRPYYGNKKFGYSGRNHFTANNQNYKKPYTREERESTYPPPGWMERPNYKHNNNSNPHYRKQQERTDAYGNRVEYGRREEYGSRKEYGRRDDRGRDYGRDEKRREDRRRDSSSDSDRSSSSRKRSASMRDIVDMILEKRLREEAMASMEAAPQHTVTLGATVIDESAPRSYSTTAAPTRGDSAEVSGHSSSSSSSSSDSSSDSDEDDELQLDPSLMHTSPDGSPLYDETEITQPSGATSTSEKSKWEEE